MKSRHNKTVGRIAGWALLLLTLLGCASTARAQSSEIDALAADAATAIRYRYKYVDSSPKVLVEDFQQDDQRSESDLGLTLADEFQRALKGREKDFFVIDRPKRPKRPEPHEPSAQELDDLQSGCPSPKHGSGSGPEIRVRGYYQLYPGNDIALRIEVLLDGAVLAEHRARLTLPPDVLHDSRPLEPEPEPVRLRGKILWVRDPSKDKTEKPVRLPRAGEKGYTMPSCVYCPNPTFSNEASHAQAEGTVLFDVELDAEGQIAAIAVVKPLPCGLTEKALDAVEHWRLKPALGPDGNPAAVRAPMEVTFRLY
jgi:TonB family protein